MKKGIIFDVDGTLWDSSVQVAQSWQVAAEKLLNGPRPITPDMISRNMGKNMKDFGDALFPDLPPAKRLEVMEACMEYENQYLEDHPGILYPQVAEVLQQLSWKYKLFIVSNCQKGYIEVLMRSCNLEEYITDIECYGNTGLSRQIIFPW
nr:HAD hydrolase-like protein [Clostridium sp. AM51-4]